MKDMKFRMQVGVMDCLRCGNCVEYVRVIRRLVDLPSRWFHWKANWAVSTTLGLQNSVTEQSSANYKVQSLTTQRGMERIGAVKGALKASRYATDTVYRKLVKMTNALVLGKADYADFIDYVNTEFSFNFSIP